MTQIANRHFNILIIGQGLAGSLLAWKMIQQGLKVMVIDNHHHHSSSKVAAGIINPITGHRVNLTEGFTEFMPVAKRTYDELHKAFDQEFLTAIKQQRLIKNLGQQEYYEKRLQQSSYQPFIAAKSFSKTKENNSLFQSAEFGIGNIQETYRVNVCNVLNSIQTWLIEKSSFLAKKINYADVVINSDSISLKADNLNISAEQIIFCEGYQAIHNPWFKNLPFKLAKGEILTVKLEQACSEMLNWGHWVIPIDHEKNTAFLGSNYAWNDISTTTNSDTAHKLFNSMKIFTCLSGKTISHRAGVRPNTINRQPIIGPHPDHSRLYCFNGFGSKGCLLIPYYADKLAQHFSGKLPLEVLLPNIDTTLALSSGQTQ